MKQILSWLAFWYFSFMFYVKKKKKKKERKDESDIKYNEKDIFTPIFKSDKGEMGYECLTEDTSSGLSDTF